MIRQTKKINKMDMNISSFASQGDKDEDAEGGEDIQSDVVVQQSR